MTAANQPLSVGHRALHEAVDPVDVIGVDHRPDRGHRLARISQDLGVDGGVEAL